MSRSICIMVFLLAGCTTALWAPDYKEVRVNGFYLNQENSDLVITSVDSAYIFPSESRLGEALLLSRKASFYPVFDEFSISKENVVSGSVSLVFIGVNPDAEIAEKLDELGFKEDPIINRLQLTEKIEGKRYLIEGALPLEKLEKEYTLMVAQPAEAIETAGKIVATPATIAYDSVVTVPAVFLMATVMALGSP